MDKEGDDECKKKGGKKDAKDDAMLKAAVHYTVYKISEEFKERSRVAFSKETILVLAEHIFQNMIHTGRELELFAKHARRTTVTPDDVKLLFRNSPTTVSHLDAILRKAEQEKRKTLPPSKAKKGASTKTSRATKAEDKNVSRTETPDSAPENALNPPKEDDNEAMEYDNDF